MTVHIIGAGIAGLSAAYHLTTHNIPVEIYDSGNHAGGRCHSFFDPTLGRLLDNGTHLILGANKTVLDMLKYCPSQAPLKKISHDFLFCNVKTRKNFQIDMHKPLQALPKFFKAYKLIAESFMNTPVNQVDTAFLIKTLSKCFGQANCTAYLAYPSLKESLVLPVVDFLKDKKVPFHFHHRLKYVKEDKLVFSKSVLNLNPNDRVIVAVDPQNLSRILVGAPEFPFETILNIHYLSDALLPENRSFIGLIDSMGHFVFAKDGVVSVTISAANALLQKYRPEIIAITVWNELTHILNTDGKPPAYRFIANKRATLLQSRSVNRSRLGTHIGSDGVFLASDSLDTDLPCTIEGAVVSGKIACDSVLQSL